MPNKINGPMRLRAGDRLNIAHQAIDILRDHLQTGSKGRKSLPYFFSISKMWTQRKFFFGIGPGQSHMKKAHPGFQGAGGGADGWTSPRGVEQGSRIRPMYSQLPTTIRSDWSDIGRKNRGFAGVVSSATSRGCELS